jgi:signal transduction histidine kinase
MEPLLRVVNLSKNFGILPAVQQVSFEIQQGEVVGLAGSIGSGKSVLVMLLAGLYEPNEGDIYFNHKHLNRSFSAKSLGIGVIHQRPTLVDQFDVITNVFLGNEIGWPGWLGWLKIYNPTLMYKETTRILSQLDVQLPSLQVKVSNLTGEQRQMIAIARVFTYPVRMVIVDEPTISLSYPYQQTLLSLIQSWRQQGVAVLFSSNNLDHLFAVTDRILIMNQGQKVADLRTDETTSKAVFNLLLGTGVSINPAPTVWDFDSFGRIREQTERLRYHQMMLEKDLAAEDTLNRQLARQLAEQVQVLDQVNLALLDAQRRLLSEVEQERKRLAREIHDQVIQDLLSINYELEGLEIEPDVAKPLADDLSDVRQGIRELVDNLRHICGDLRPPTIDSLGLGAALQSYCRNWSTRTGLQVNLDLDSNLGRLPEASELSIFRIVQEGLNNVWRHANASCVQIVLEHTSPRTLLVSIEDDGIGIPGEIDLADLSKNGHFGLLGISERVALLGGKMSLKRQSKGSLLQIEIPHPKVAFKVKSNQY